MQPTYATAELDTAEVMQSSLAPSSFLTNRYSAKRMTKPVSFFHHSAQARAVFMTGDFNGWNQTSHRMRRQPDGGWTIQIPLHHGHHRYLFLVDDVPALGHGKAKQSVATHKCTSCGAETLACCNTSKDSTVATKGMEKKDVEVAPLK